jgi:hypothetical protein
MLSGATRSEEHQREFLTSDVGSKREDEKEDLEEERVLPAALTQRREYLDRFWDEDRMVEEKRKNWCRWSRDTSHSAAGRGTSREESKATSGVAQEGWLLSRAGPEGVPLGAPGAFLGPFLGLSGQHRSPGWLLGWSDAAAGGGMWLLWCVLDAALQRWA